MKGRVGQVCYLADDAPRIANDDCARGDVANDDGAGADEGMLTDDNAGEYRGVRTDLGAPSNHHTRELILDARRQRIFRVRQHNVRANPACKTPFQKFNPKPARN